MKTNESVIIDWAKYTDDKNEEIINATKEKNLEEIERIFKTLVQSEKANNITYRLCIKAFAKNKDFAKATEILEMAIKDKKIDETTYNYYLDLVGYRSGKFEEMKKIFWSAVKRGLVDDCTYTTYLAIAKWHQKFDEVQRVFDCAMKNRIESISIYNVYIDALGKQGRYQEAEMLFWDVVHQIKANSMTYVIYFTQARVQKIFNDNTKQAFLTILTMPTQNINAAVCNAYIVAAGNAKAIDQVNFGFHYAVMHGKADAATYCSVISALSLSGWFGPARQIFLDACMNKKVDNITIETYGKIANWKGNEILQTVYEQDIQWYKSGGSNIFWQNSSQNNTAIVTSYDTQPVEALDRNEFGEQWNQPT